MTRRSTRSSESGGFRFSGRFAAMGAPVLAGVWALLVAGLLLLPSAQFSPALAAVTCGSSWERGTLNANGNWTAGSGADYRVQCAGDSNDDTLRAGDLPTPPQGAGRLVVETSGTIGGGSGRGIRLRDQDLQGVSRLVVINRGSVTTSGGEYAYGIDVRRTSGAGAEARAVNKGNVATSGLGSRGVYAEIDGAGAGTATAVNEGNITTSGDPVAWATGDLVGWQHRLLGSHGLRAQSEGTGDASATNEAGATIHVSGDGADGVSVWAANGGNATATNRGTVTVTGNYAVGTETIRFSSAEGVTASTSGGGNARAVNEAGGVITTGSVDAKYASAEGRRGR